MKKTGLITLCAICIFSNLNTIAQGIETPNTADSSKEQREMWNKEFGLTEQQGIIIQKLSFKRTRQIDSLNQISMPNDEFLKKRDDITNEYYMNVKAILTEEQKALFNIGALKAARTDEIRILKLPPRTAIEMGKLKDAYIKSIEGLPKNKKERRIQKAELEEEYHTNIYNLIGKDKFAVWIKFRETRLERKYIEKYSFTKEQFNLYKEFENKQAIDILKIKNSAIAKEIKKIKIQEIKNRKIKNVEKILSAEQFQKWYSDYIQAEERKQHDKR